MAVTCSAIKEWMLICEILGGCGSQGGVTGDLIVEGGVLWVYDETRGKWLSSSRITAISGRKGRIKNGYLRLIDGQTSNLTGYRMTRSGVLTSLAVQTRTDETWTLRVRNNGIDIASLAITAADGAHNRTLNVNVEEGDLIEFYADTTAFMGIRDPFVWAEIAWRNDNL